MKSPPSTNGSILMEVLVSLFILSLGLTGGATLIIMSITSNQINKNRVIATNLAQEGIEGIRNIRDTNWLTYSSNLRECWLFWEDTNEDGVIDDDDEPCTPNINGQNDHPIGKSNDNTYEASFLVDFGDVNTNDFRWIVLPENLFSSGSIDTSKDYSDGFQLFEASVPIDDTETKTITLYTHNKKKNVLENYPASPFSRTIDVYYIDSTSLPLFDDSTDPITGGLYPLGLPSEDNRILIVSTVNWRMKGRDYEVVVSTILTDFFNREEWDS